jgi:hypothetical protein
MCQSDPSAMYACVVFLVQECIVVSVLFRIFPGPVVPNVLIYQKASSEQEYW